jgi:zinc transport system substrate-binding protein
MSKPTTSRRAVLAGLSGAVATLAGCTSTVESIGAPDGNSVAGSFPVVTEFARQVAGDAASVSGLVPLGQHGHGWQPAATVGRDVRAADAFVYVGEGFQPWADRLVNTLREEGSPVAAIAAREGVDLLPPPEHGAHDDHGEGDSHDDEHGNDEDDHETTHDGEHDSEPEHEGDDDEHDHGPVDPHYWLDPTRAAVSVGTVAEGLATFDPENRATYERNAESFRAELADLDRTIERRLADRSRNAVLVAGHDAFQYLGRRYGVEIHALSGISPDANPSPADVRRAQELVEREGITHVLAPAFESDRAARQLVADTDAEAVLPVTSFAGLRREWVDAGWGYREVMERVNLDSLATALGAA